MQIPKMPGCLDTRAGDVPEMTSVRETCAKRINAAIMQCEESDSEAPTGMI
jgi:hypothetical protein